MRQNIWCWPIGIASVAVYTVVFFQARLFSDMLLQGVYVALQSYGWWNWRYRREAAPRARRGLPVSRLAPTGAALASALVVIGTLLLGGFMTRYTTASFPFVDAFAATLSLAAQWLQARKILESWLVFIAANALFIGIYWSKGLYLTIGLFIVLTIMAVLGLVRWRESLRTL